MLTTKRSIYFGEGIPLYTAAKYGIVGLTRAMAKRLQDLKEPITVNCICPGLVDTGLTPALMAAAPTEHVTPRSTIVKAVLGFVEDDSLTGKAAECSVDKIYYRDQCEWSDESAKYIMTTDWGSNPKFQEYVKQATSMTASGLKQEGTS
jgi:15-hydroxyprostaglandin dehydrogenase (NAD)